MKKVGWFLFISIILASLLSFHWKNINAFPSKIHAWAQSDRYVLAIGFLNNNFDFFHPQTFNYTQSPDHNLIPRETTITAVDFPISDYLAAVLMKIFGTKAPWCFRLYTLFYSLVGLFFLFLLSKRFVKSRILSVFVVLFCVTSPVYLYYQVGFLPTIPAISNLFIGLYLFVRYLEDKRPLHYTLSILFITISVLSRKPFLIFLLALMAFELWVVLKSRKISGGRTLALVLSAVIIGGFFLYNRYLEHTYGAAFLGIIMPPKSISQVVEITKTVYHNWFFQYFTGYHYALLIVLLFTALILSWIRITRTDENRKFLRFYIALTFIGFSGYYLLMMQQFPQHDYYFLDSFYGVICLGLIYLVSCINLDTKILNGIGGVGTLFLIVILFTVNRRVQEKREETGFWDRVEITTNNFDGAENLLNEKGIPATAKILVIDSYTANIPFIKMNRFGFAMMSKKSEDIKKSLIWNYDYIVMQDCYTLSDIIVNYPQITNEIERIGGNGRISIYKRQQSSEKIDGFRFLQIDSKTPFLSKRFDFDTIPESCWQNIYSKRVQGSIYSTSGALTDSIEFSATLSLKNCEFLIGQENLVTLELDVLTDEILNNCFLSLSVEESGKSKYFNTFDLNGLVKTKSTWSHIQLVYPIVPSLKTNNNELKVFIWNAGKHNIYYDNVLINIYVHD